jgi:hypothetical protein
MSIEVRYDRERGCGWRKPGGLYFVADGPGRDCGKLPIPLTVCPTCSGGIKPTRGVTWVDADKLTAAVECRAEEQFCAACPLNKMGRAILIWIGEAFYKRPGDWLKECGEQGVSRRVNALPTGFVIGETWILCAHRKGISARCEECTGSGVAEGEPCEACEGTGKLYTAAAFHAFRPSAVEYVCTGTETDEELEALRKRGITPVRVERVEEQPGQAMMFVDAEGAAAA